MTEIPILSGPSYGPDSGQTHKLVILLHGRGADGNDLIGLAPHFAKSMPDALFVSPNAPYPCSGLPFGREWFSLDIRTPEHMLEGARQSHLVIDTYIDQQLSATGLNESDLALVGFSQGTMMSLFTGPRREKQIAGILGYSGRLIGGDLISAEARSRPPVVLINGDQDELIDISAQTQAIEGLKAGGVSVDAYVRPGLGHSIDEEGIRIGIEFLDRILKATK